MTVARVNMLSATARRTVYNRTEWLDEQCRRIAADAVEIRVRHALAAERFRALRVKYL